MVSVCPAAVTTYSFTVATPRRERPVFWSCENSLLSAVYVPAGTLARPSPSAIGTSSEEYRAEESASTRPMLPLGNGEPSEPMTLMFRLTIGYRRAAGAGTALEPAIFVTPPNRAPVVLPAL